MTTIKERVLLISEYYDIKKEKFFLDLGLSYANFKGNQKKTSLSSDAIDKILSKYPKISVSWLVLGQGTMLETSNQVQTEQKPPEEEINVYLELIYMQKKEIVRLEKEIGEFKIKSLEENS